MTAPDIDLDTDDVRRHATRIAGFSDGVVEAYSAANQVAMDDDAYGVICSFLPKVWINDLEETAIAGIRAGTDLLTGGADALRALADTLDAADRAAANRLGGD